MSQPLVLFVALGLGVLIVALTWDRGPERPVSGRDDIGRRLIVLTKLAVWFGAITGTLYALAVLTIRLLDDRLMFHHREVLWMSPVAHVATNLAGAVLLAPLALLGRDRFVRLAAGAFVVFSTVSLLLRANEIARWALFLLAAGLAVQLVRLGWTLGRRAWRFAGTVAVIVGLVSSIQIGSRTLAEHRGLSEVVERADTPNVLLIVLDTVRARDMSLYGYARETTPALRRWAADGTVFDMAIAPSSWTLPSHAAILTGEIGSASGGGWLRPVRLGDTSLPERYRSAGYATGGFAANLLYTSYEAGLSDPFLHYEGYRRNPFQVLLHSPFAQVRLPRALFDVRSPTRMLRTMAGFSLQVGILPADDVKPAPLVTDGFLAWQQSLGERPFFAFLNYFEAHAPFRAPDEYLERFRTEGGGDLNRYDASIAFLDAELDRLFATLAMRGVLDDTVIVVTSDHGELFGEHGLDGHANGLYLPLIRVPLLMRYPARVPPGVRVSEAVSLIDLAATMLDLSGLDATTVPGASLAGLFGNGPAMSARTAAVSELMRARNIDGKQPNAKTWLQSVVRGQFHFIRDGEGREELYDLNTDPSEEANRLTTYGAEADRLRGLLEPFPPPSGGGDSRP